MQITIDVPDTLPLFIIQQRIKDFEAILTKEALERGEQETAYLLKSETMKQRLLTAKGRTEGIAFGEACEKLGI